MDLTNTYLFVLVALLGASLAAAMLKPERTYEYPYFMAAVFAVFIMPQAISLIRFPGEARPEWVANVLLMSCLCFAMCWLGYRLPPIRSVQELLAQPVNLDRLFQGGLVFIAVSFFFRHLLSQMTEDEKGGSMWTGPSTIYLFFNNLIYPAFAICLLTALRTQSLLAWAATVIAAIQPIQATVFWGRREPTIQFLLTLALTLYFHRGIKLPRWVILSAITGAMLAIPATGTYRGLAAKRDWEQVRQMDLVKNYRQYLSEESTLELRNAAVFIEGTRRSEAYEFGKSYWDQLVFRFVPAQLLGTRFKASLMFEPSADRIHDEVATLGYEIPPGSTLTGMGDSFRQFGWFGCLFFALLAVVFKSLFRATEEPNAIFAQLFYIQIGTAAMRTVTHQTVDFLPGLMYYVIFLGLLFLYAREKSPRSEARPTTRRIPTSRHVEQRPTANPTLTARRAVSRRARANHRRFPARGSPSAPFPRPLSIGSGPLPSDENEAPRQGSAEESS